MPENAWTDRLVRPAWEAIRTRADLSVLWAVVRGHLHLHHRPGSNEGHLRATLAWLCQAQDATKDDGVSAAYDIVADSWYPSYPETTGYIIPTFFDYAALTGDVAARARAIRMADWLLSLQLECGAFPGPPWLKPKGQPIVFDTGQIIHGLVRAFEETGDTHYLEAAHRAGGWLVEIQEADGSWRQFDMEYPHTYNSRSAWALLALDQIDARSQYRTAALRHLEWVLNQQTPEGWFHHAAFKPDEDPLTHTLAYTLEGLLEAERLLSEPKLVEAVRVSANALRDLLSPDGHLDGTYGPGWRSETNWTCLTGNAQMALVWFRLYQMTADSGYLQAATAANRYLKRCQRRSAGPTSVRGGIAGSQPIYGDYGRYLYLNWAAKFFADSLMREEQVIGQGAFVA